MESGVMASGGDFRQADARLTEAAGNLLGETSADADDDDCGTGGTDDPDSGDLVDDDDAVSVHSANHNDPGVSDDDSGAPSTTAGAASPGTTAAAAGAATPPVPLSNRAQYKCGAFARMYVKSSWARSFPNLFLFGRGGPNEIGLKGISLETYVRHVLQLSHRSFARSHEFVCVGFDVLRSSAGHIPANVRATANPDDIASVTEDDLRAGIALTVRQAQGEDVDFSILPTGVRKFLNVLKTGRRHMTGTSDEAASAR